LKLIDKMGVDESPVGKKPVLNEDMANVVAVDNIPKIGMERYERLTTVINKIFAAYGDIVPGGLYLPVEGPDDKKKTCGYAFIEYATPRMAQNAVAQGDNKRLDNKHKMRVNVFADFKKFGEMSEEYTPPEVSDFDDKTNLKSWMLDPNQRDQFVVRHSKETEIYWNDPFRKARDNGRELKYGGENQKVGDKQWTELYTAWSSKGSYLATFHHQGIVLWGGDKFERLQRFSHPGVQVLDFSPCETYLVTCNRTEKKNKTDPDYIIVWDVRSGKKLRSFDSGGPFRWSHDDKYFSRVGPDVISVYETPSMGLLNKKSFKIPGVKEAQWSPDQNILAYWVPESKESGANAPATVALLEIPSRKIIREKNMFNVEDIKMTWQDQGNYLCVKMSRRKSKKTIINNFEIFRLRDKDIPVEALETDNAVMNFAWEPNGHRFAMIHRDNNRQNVSIYAMKSKKMKKLVTLENRNGNCLFWSPNGETLIIAGLADKNGILDFVDTAKGGSMDTIVVEDHFMARDVEWDPSGRFVISSVTQPLLSAGFSRYTMENGYKMWNQHGSLLANVKLEACYQVIWRPRPKSLLSREQEEEVVKNMKSYVKKFEQEDNEIRLSQLSGAQKQKREWKEGWKAYRAEKLAEYKQEAASREELRGGLVSDDENDYEDVEEVEEVEISREEKVVGE
jgi:translation initiation factor 3 subunit B